jgi:S1-C subfamily serine protease/predicted esterase
MSALASLCLATVADAQSSEDTLAVQERAMRAAVGLVAPSVVQIETSGGTDVIGFGQGQIRRGVGPTTGLVVGADGYVISSAFNFANKPSAIFVAVPGLKERLVAKVVATDHTRMLTLLKIQAVGLRVPVALPKKEIQVGQWALALGRTWTSLDAPPAVSIGIVSAVGRIWGTAIQTDAKVSPVNYGGPLIDLTGRVIGVLVPASPRGQDETAGVEWYDSGIGFAIPLEDLNRVLPRLKEGKDLTKGMLGVSPASADLYGPTPAIATVAPDSTAQRAGIRPGDIITEIDGLRVERQAHVLHLLGQKYDGDIVSVKVRRGDKDLSFPNLKLSSAGSWRLVPFLGILPVRDDPELGEEIRYVFPKSPADAAGLKPGDRLLKVGFGSVAPRAFSGRDDLTALLDRTPAGTELTLEVKRKGAPKTENVKVRLGIFSDVVPEELPEPASHRKALEPRKRAPRGMPPDLTPPRPDQPPRPPRTSSRPGAREPEAKKDDKPEPKKVETGLLKRTTPAGDHRYWCYVPEDYDRNIAYALVIWLHPAGKGGDKDRETERVVAAWEDFCSENHVILLCPRAANEAGWLGSENESIEQMTRQIMDEYTIDHQRIVAHGMGLGGQMAFYLGFHSRDLIRGVATTGAAMTTSPKENVVGQRLAFFLVAGGKDPLLQAIVESKAKLLEHKFPVAYQEIPEMGQQYFDAVTLRELIRWIDSLDRQ